MDSIYEKLLKGSISFDEFVKLDKTEVDDNCEVYVHPYDVISMLNRYLSKKISSQELSNWADILVSHNIYVTEGWESDSVADKHEPMWNTLQKIATPYLDGDINLETIKVYADDLASLYDVKKK